MNIDEIKKKKKDIEEKYGPWTAHDILLGDGIHTMDNLTYELEEIKAKKRAALTDEQKPYAFHLLDSSYWEKGSPNCSRTKRIVQIISDICQKPWEKLRVLDLACMEGGFSFELAFRGANVLGIEGREANIVKAQFAKEVLSITNVDFIQDDVRNISSAKYGRFDVVLCIGLLYHLDNPTIFSLLEQIAEVCDCLLVIDTHVSIYPEQSVTYKEKTYWGRFSLEHNPADTEEEKLKNLWQSLDSDKSFTLTRFSLFNFLQQIGFSSVYECNIPPAFWACGTRSTFVAINGQKIEQVFTSRENLIEEEYKEIDSGKNDSESHVLKTQLDSLKNHPYVRLGSSINKFLKKIKGGLLQKQNPIP